MDGSGKVVRQTKAVVSDGLQFAGGVFGVNEATAPLFVEPSSQCINRHVDERVKRLKFTQNGLTGCAKDVGEGLLGGQRVSGRFQKDEAVGVILDASQPG